MPISMHWIHRQRKLRRASKFDARHFQGLLNPQNRSMWQHQHQLRCLNLADHVPKGPPATFLPTPPEIASMKTDSYEEDRKARLNEEGMYLRVKYPSEIDWTSPLWEQLAAVLKGGPSPNSSQAELRALRAKVPELTKVQFENLFPADNVITATKNHAVRKIHMSEPAAWVLKATHWVQSIGSADDDCHMVS